VEAFAHWLVEFIHGIGYLGIFIGMALGNMLVPIPVEMVMIPAGYLIQQGNMSFLLAILASVTGDIAGSLVSFFVALHFGRRVLINLGKYVGLKKERIDALDRFFVSHGEVSVLTGRLVPGLRHFMAFPAGLSHMHVKKFMLYTGAGGGLWSGILLGVGYAIGGNREMVAKYLPYIEGVVIAGVATMIIVYMKRHRKHKPEVVNDPS
jgi:membrane protein DedA with SNARE-associated domain